MLVFESVKATNGVCVYKPISLFPRGEKSVLWFFGEPARSFQLSGHSRLCRDAQLPWPDAGRWALLPEAFLRGGSAWGVYAAEPDRSGKANKMWRNSGRKTACREACFSLKMYLNVLWMLLCVLLLDDVKFVTPRTWKLPGSFFVCMRVSDIVLYFLIGLIDFLFLIQFPFSYFPVWLY